ncbi:Na+/H+ antiporter subunit A [Lysinibacillus sp. KCTC 33748]|uniref:Na+/H+ antiporter subunit A n=1 Tax=unclassified Lysinibacillus TaxID=2636778 RepID=UPI0009A581AA|nr:MULTISPECIES: Na+/H+ antiporter subunit A [unclassified Lysinibacillus]OXS70488.1 Na+/H+ antiporter subunit A [Lysinibacillus sp. KCTC 33748]SKC01659.1 multisubunit sodium/proton antiporter, MrpA subunit [Lysinibacillus sp. AC-3]
MVTVLIAILLPFVCAALIPLLYRRLRRVAHLGWFVLSVPFILFLLLARYIPQIAEGKTFIHTYEWIPSFNINFTTYLDGLSMIFGLLITGVGSLVILYSIFYLSTKESLHHFYCYLLLFMGAMLGVVFSDNLMVLYTFWELTSVSSFLLIAFWHHRKASRAGARKAMTITVFGGLSMLAGFLMLYVASGTFSIREIVADVEVIRDHTLFIPALILILIGAFTKSAQFPFHIWLPDAMEAPTPVSAYLHSATMVKAGIYLVARFSPVFGGEAVWFWLVSVIGLVTLFWGSFNAVRQTDLKALLAFSTVSQLGLIMSLFGLGSVAHYYGYAADTVLYTQASFAALFHLINHSTFKGALFMMVGIVDHEVGTRDIRRLGGLMALMPITFTIAVIGGFSMAGLPPFNGFLSKEMFFAAALTIRNVEAFSISDLGLLFPIVAWVASIFTFVYCMILISRTFFGKLQLDKLDKKPHEAPLGMLLSPIILCVFVVGIFFFPNVLGHYILDPAMASIYPAFPSASELTPHIHAWHGINAELLMTVGVIIIGIILFKTLKSWKPLYRIFPQRYTFNMYYNRLIEFGENSSAKLTNRYMTGNLTHYFVYIYVFFVALIAGYFIWSDAIAFNFAKDSAVESYELILVFVMMFAAVWIIFAKGRVTAMLLNGVLGYSIAFFFVIFRAPDLALTQLVVESVTTALFLLCFKYLPDLMPEASRKKMKWSKVIISIFVGATVTLVGLAVVHFDRFEPVATYFNDSYKLAGGSNIVNTILGDFRAFDTMLEVVVLLIAGLGVYTLTKLKPRKEETDHENQ